VENTVRKLLKELEAVRTPVSEILTGESKPLSADKKYALNEALIKRAYHLRYGGRLDDPKLNENAKRTLAARKTAMEIIMDNSPNMRERIYGFAAEHEKWGKGRG
jgi:hypothetical protein